MEQLHNEQLYIKRSAVRGGGVGDELFVQNYCLKTWTEETTWESYTEVGDNIKTNIKDTGWDNMNWIHLAQDRVHWSACVSICYL